MDAVILAAGKGERLAGIMPRYHKPLLVVNGRPLVRTAVEHAIAAGAGRIVVVVAPENAMVINEVLGDLPAFMIVQRVARGPGDGLLHGLEVCLDSRALVLMGDNVLTFEDVRDVAQHPRLAVGVRKVFGNDEAARFTRLRTDNTWVEKIPIDPELDLDSNGDITAWVGPITVDTVRAKRVLIKSLQFGGLQGEVPIGPYLHAISPDAALVTTTAVDIGTPEAVKL